MRWSLYYTFAIWAIFVGSNLEAQPPTLIANPSTSYCQGSGGVMLGVNNSVTGASYTLQRQTGSWVNVATIASAVGGTDYFTGTYTAGNYRLSSSPAVTLTVTQIPLPENLYNVTVSIASGGKLTASGAGYCSGSVNYPSIGLSGSQPGASGVTYKLYKDGVWYNSLAIAGTGAAISFGPVPNPGVYTVKAERNGCQRDMTGSKTITVFPLPTVSFTSSPLGPPDDCGTAQFNPVITYTPPGSGAPYIYSWDFGTGSNPATSVAATPTCQFPAYGTGTQSFPVTLQVVDKNGCAGSSNNNVMVTQRPDALLDASPFWNNCSNSSTFAISIINRSTTAATNTGYIIDWDDPNDPVDVTLTPAQFPYNGSWTHTYTSTGTFHLTITATGPGPNNCNDTRVFPVFNGSTPTGGITYDAGILQGCKPHTITFYLDGNAQNNAPTTYYFFDFGDGTAPYTFTQETMPALFPDGKYHIVHTFDTASCSAPGNAFNLTHYIENPCSTVPNNVGGIKISEKSHSDFLRNEYPDDPILVCAGVPRTYTNNTIEGCIIYAGAVYNNTNYYWDFYNDGSVESTDVNPVFTFPTPGTYEVKLRSVTGEAIPNNCGDSVIVREVCVQDVPVADFSFTDPAPYCVNTPYTPENSSTFQPACALPQYVWTVTPNSGFTFTSGSNGNSFEPTFNFTVPGVYTIQLDVNMYTGTTICSSASHQEVVTILGPPSVTVNQANIPLCGPDDVDLATVVSYNANGGTISDYLWTITPPGPTITTPTDPFPIVSITGDVTQVYTLTLTATNECGTSTPVQLTISVTQTLDNNTVSYAGATDLCSGMTLSDDIVGSVPTGGDGTYSYQWYIEESAGWTLLPNTTQSLDYNLPLTVSPTHFRRTVISGNCTLVSNTITFTLYPGIQNNTISSAQMICNGDPVTPVTGSLPTQGNGTYTYLWQQSTNAPLFDTWTDAPLPNDQQGFSPTGVTQTTRYRRIVYSGLCNNLSNELEITVNEIPSVTSVSTITICSGTSLNYAITSTVAGTTYSWAVTDLSGGTITGFSNYPGGTISTIPDPLVNSSNVLQSIQYTITPVGPVPTQCPGSPFVLTVSVRPAFTSTYTDMGITVGTNTIISGSIGGGTPGYSYSWTPVSMLSAPAQATLANPQTALLFADQTFNLTVTDAANCQYVQDITITTGGTLLQVDLSSDDPDQNICFGDQVTLTATASGGAGNGIPGNYTYSWTGIPAGATYIQPWIVEFVPQSIGANNYSVEIGDGFTTATDAITIIANEIPVVTSPLSVDICSGDNVNYTPTSNVAGTTFTWLRGTNACISSFPAATTGNNTISNTLTNSCNTSQSITYTITPTGPAPTFCPGTPVVLTVAVMPVSSITTTPLSQVVNTGLSSTPVTLVSDVTGAGFEWQFFSLDCPAFFGSYLPGGNTNTLPAQTFTILPGGPNTCEICYEAHAYTTLTDGTQCPGPAYYYCYTVNLEPVKYNLICPAPACEGSTSDITLENSDIGIDYQLYQDGNPYGTPQPGCNCPITWSGITQGGVYTVIATNTNNGVSVPMNNSCTVVFNPNPIPNFLIGSTGNCPGDFITLNGSETDVEYELFWNGTSTGNIQTGPGPLNFGPQSNPGIYTITATNSVTGCWSDITGSIVFNASPQEFIFTPAGPQCAGDAFGISGSETGVSYELWCTPLSGGTPVYIGTWIGDGSPLDFGNQTIPGTYSVHAINMFTGCDIYFSDTKILWPLPEQYNITPQGPPICGMTTIGLSNSQPGYTYEVHLLDISGLPYPTPSPYFSIETGTGSPLVFGTSNMPGTYVIIGYDQFHICSAQMYGSVTILAEPTQYWISPTGTINCIDQATGVEILLTGSENGVEYTLSNGGSVNITLPGTGSPINFGFQNQPGTYTITAINPGNSCTSDMLGNVTLVLNPSTFTLQPVTASCPGVEVWLNGSESGVTYDLYIPEGGFISMPGTGSAITWGIMYTPGNYHVEAHFNGVPACPTLMDGTVTIHPNPGIFDVVPQGVNCDSVYIGLNGSELNTTYELLHADFTSLSPPEIYIPVVPGPFQFTNPQHEGSYIVKAINQFLCDTIMAGTVIIEGLPIVDAGPDSLTVCIPPSGSITLSGSATDYSSVLWSSPTDPGGTNFSSPTGLTTTYTFTATDLLNKEVELKLTAFGAGACIGNQAVDSILIHILTPSIEAGPDQNVCADVTTVTMTGYSFNEATGAVWSGGTGSWAGDVYTPTAAEKASGSVVLTYTTNTAAPCAEVSDTKNVTFQALPVIDAGPDQAVCADVMTVAMLGYSYTGATGANWSGGLGSWSGDVYTPTAAEKASGSVIMTYTTNTASPCGEVNDTKTVTFQALPVIDAGPDQTVCADATTVTMLGYSFSGATGAVWSGGSGSWAGDTYTPTAGEIASGSVVLTYTTSSAAPCAETSDTKTITFQALPLIDAGPDQTVCEDVTTVTMLGYSYSGASGAVWSGGLGSWAGDVYTPTPAEKAAGSIILTYTTNTAAPCGEINDTKTVTFQALPVINAGPDQTVCADVTTVTMSGYSYSGATGAAWSGGLGSWSGDVYTPTASEKITGSVILTYTTNTASPCSDVSDTKTIIFQALPVVDAGPDQTECADVTTVMMQGFSFSGATGAVWSGGAGSWAGSVYTPTAAEKTAGSVILTLTTSTAAPCADVSDSKTVTFQALPAINAGPDQTVCADVTTVTMQGYSYSGATAAVWSGGSGSWAGDVYTPSAGEKAAGMAILTYSTNTSAPCNEVTDNMTVIFNPLPTVFAGSPKSACVSQQVPLSDASASNYQPATLFWTVVNGSGTLNDYTIVNPVYTPGPLDGGTTVTLTLTVSGVAACLNHQVSSSVDISFDPMPQADAGPDMTNCISVTSVQITGATASNYSLLSWQHNGFGSLVNPQNIDPTYFPQPADGGNTVTFTLTATGQGACSIEEAVSTMTITFDRLPVVNAGPGGTTCETDGLDLNGSAQYASHVLWDIVDGSGSFVNPTSAVTTFFPANVTIPTLMTLRLTAFGNGSCINATSESLVQITVVPTPEVYAGPNDTLCGLLPYNLSLATVLNAGTIYWTTSGTGQFSNQYTVNPTYFPSNADMLNGSVVLTIEVTDPVCGTVTDNMTLTLSQVPVSYYTFTTPACSGSDIFFHDLSVAGTGFIKQWIWNWGDGSPNDTIIFPDDPNRWKSFANPGTYPVRLTILNSLGCTDEFMTPVTLLPSPIANFHYYHPCDSTAVQFTDASYPNGAGNVVAWHWDFGDPTTGVNNTSTLKDPTHIFSHGDTTYTVTLIITNFNNCTDTMVKQVYIKPAPPVEYTYTVACLNSPVTFGPDTTIINISTIGSWYWDFGDGITSNDMYTAHIFNAPGNYPVVLEIEDTAGCRNSITHIIPINPLPLAHFDAGTLNCSDATVQFNELSSTYVGYIVQWDWNFGDGTTQTVYHPSNPNVIHTYASNGTYQVTLTVHASDSCSSSETQTLNIYPKPEANFDYGSTCDGMAVPFTDLSQGNGGGSLTQWIWDFGDPTTGVANGSTLQSPSHLFSGTGTYTVRLIVMTSNSCTDTVTRQVTILAKPAVDFTTLNTCQNVAVQFQPNPAGMNINIIGAWSWNFGDGGTANTSSATHVYPVSGTYNVTLTVTDTGGCMNSITKPVVIAPEPVANFDYSQPACKESAIQFTSLSSTTTGYLQTWVWDFGDNTTQTITFPAIPNVTHIYSGYGTFNVTLTVTTNTGCSKTIIKSVIVAPTPLANFTFDAGCFSSPVQFSDLSQAGTGSLSNWLWNFGEPASGTANQSSMQNPAHTYASATSYTVTLIVTNSSGCKDTISKPVTVTNPPSVDFTSQPGCVDDSTQFTASLNAGLIASVEWTFGDGGTSTVLNPYHVYTLSGTFTVTLMATDTSGCSNSISHTVTITPPPVALFQAGTPSCSGMPVQFDDLSSATGGQITFWHWYFGDGTDILINAPANPDVSHTYSSAGTFNVVLEIGTSLGCEASADQDVVISTGPLAEFEYGNSCAGNPVSFTNLSGTNGGPALIGYLWDFGDPGSGTANSSNLSNPSHIYTATGTYTVTLYVTNAGGCQDTVYHSVLIHPIPAVDFTWSNTCLGSTTNFSVSPAVTNIPAVQTFDWDFGDGSQHSALQAPVHVYALPGTYTVVLNIVDTAGCENSVSHPLIISPQPVAQFSYENSCLNAPMQFFDLSYSSGGEPITGWHWDFGTTAANDTSNLQNPSWTYTSTGSYTVTLIVTNAGGCKDTLVKSVSLFSLPVADFSFAAPACQNGTVFFQDESTGQQSIVVDWLWEFEPNQFSTERNPIHTFWATDSCYNVKLVVTDNRGCTNTIIKPVCVPASLSIAINYTPTCYLDTTFFSTQVLQPANDYLTDFSWNFGDPASGSANSSTLATPWHVFTEAGTYTVILEALDKDNCPVTKYAYVDVRPLPVPVFSFAGGVCDSTIYFNESSTGSGAGIISWHWDFGDGQSVTVNQASQADVTHKYGEPGTYLVSLTVTNNRNCENTYSHEVLVQPCLQTEITAVDTLFCENHTIAFADISYSGIEPDQWHWDFGDGTVLDYTHFRPVVTHTYALTGSYSVKLRISADISGTTISDSSMISVFVKPAPVAAFNMTDVCLGDSVHFNNLSTGNGTIISGYKWKFDDPAVTNDVSLLESPVHRYQIAGWYDPYLVVTNSLGCTDTVTNPLIVNRPPVAGIRIENPCAGSVTQFHDDSEPGFGPITSWNWSVSATTGFFSEDSIAAPRLIFETTGEYTVNMIVMDTNGCSDTASRLFEVSPSPVSEFTIVDNYENVQGQLQIQNGTVGGTTYYWNFGNGTLSVAESPIVKYDAEGHYPITLIAANASGCTDTITRVYDLLFKGLYIPSGFVPQDPGGDVSIFQPVGVGLQSYKIEVFDKWGNLIWASEELIDGQPGPGWDGTKDGEPVALGVYIWKASAVFKDGSVWNGKNVGENKGLSGETFGTITVVR